MIVIVDALKGCPTRRPYPSDLVSNYTMYLSDSPFKDNLGNVNACSQKILDVMFVLYGVFILWFNRVT